MPHEMRHGYVAQAGLKLVYVSDPPISASREARLQVCTTTSGREEFLVLEDFVFYLDYISYYIF